jgi:RNA polymerase sigma factor (sigma-70 family)
MTTQTAGTQPPPRAKATPDGLRGARRGELEALLLAQLPVLDRIVAVLGARNRLEGAELEDFGAWVRLRIVENDYAILRKFTGRSSLPTYLSAVVANLLRDHRVRRDGRWRPSAAALRMGEVAIRLERLLYQRGMGFSAAVRTLRGEGVSEPSDRELARLASELPLRTPIRPEVQEPHHLSWQGERSADEGVLEFEAQRDREGIIRALTEVLAGLPPEDQLLVRLRLWEEMSVADIARALSLPQKPLYRRMDALLRSLRGPLEGLGVTAERVSTLLTSPFPIAPESADLDPSI